MVTTLLNLRIKCVLKYSAFVILFLVIFYYLKPLSHSYSPVDRSEWYKAAVAGIGGSNNGYHNSQNLVEKLRPKLVTSNSSDHHGEPVWNELNVARSQQEVFDREEGYKLFAFNTLVRYS